MATVTVGAENGHDIKLYYKSPLYLMRGELFDTPQKQHG